MVTDQARDRDGSCSAAVATGRPIARDHRVAVLEGRRRSVVGPEEARLLVHRKVRKCVGVPVADTGGPPDEVGVGLIRSLAVVLLDGLEPDDSHGQHLAGAVMPAPRLTVHPLGHQHRVTPDLKPAKVTIPRRRGRDDVDLRLTVVMSTILCSVPERCMPPKLVDIKPGSPSVPDRLVSLLVRELAHVCPPCRTAKLDEGVLPVNLEVACALPPPCHVVLVLPVIIRPIVPPHGSAPLSPGLPHRLPPAVAGGAKNFSRECENCIEGPIVDALAAVGSEEPGDVLRRALQAEQLALSCFSTQAEHAPEEGVSHRRTSCNSACVRCHPQSHAPRWR